MTACGERHTSAREPPVGGVVAERRGREPGAQLVGDHDVEQGVERLPTAGGGDLARHVRPVASAFCGGEGLDDDQPLPVAPGRAACRPPPSGRRRRAGGVPPDRRARPNRSGTGRCIVSRQPGSPSSTKPVRNDSRIFMACGRVSATTRPPRSAATVGGAQLPLVPGRIGRRDAEQVPVERPVGGHRHVGEQGDLVVGEARCRQPGMIASSVVPGWSRTPAASASSSSRRRAA